MIGRRRGAPPGPGVEGGRRAAPPRSCYDHAVALLARRSHFERELQLKLSGRGHPAAEVAATMARLRREGLLDDRRTAEEWLQVRRRRGEGPRRLGAGLARQGLDREAIAGHLAAGFEDEVAGARQAAERWLARQGGATRPADPAALARHLDRRGWGRRAILSVLDELQTTASEPSLDEQPVDDLGAG